MCSSTVYAKLEATSVVLYQVAKNSHTHIYIYIFLIYPNTNIHKNNFLWLPFILIGFITLSLISSSARRRRRRRRKSVTSAVMNDTVDKLVIFLAKRDGIDKLVKTFQYVSKLVHWHVEATHPEAAKRAKQWEVASGLSRKAFRSGRFLTGFNALRRNPGPTRTLRSLAVLANAGEMVYFFFDHFLWLARIGVLDAELAKMMSFISAFGESFGYIFFIITDFIMIRKGFREQQKIAASEEQEQQSESESRIVAKASIKKIKVDRVMRFMAVAANVADLIIALAEIEPNPFCNHAVTLGISGLVSAWAGWYRNWPS